MKVLIAIHGSHAEPDRMAAQRDTWLKDLTGADYKYFLGLPLDGASGAEWESPDVFYINSPDGPVWEGTRRTWVLNRKTEALARYALKHGYDYCFKCDDDTYVYPERLLASGFEAHDYTGLMDTHQAEDVGTYSWAQGGAGYWLSSRAMSFVATGLTRVRAEDFAVGQLLAANGITAHHDGRYYSAVQQGEYPKSDPITLHKVGPDWMRAIHQTPLPTHGVPNYFQSLAKQFPQSR